MDVFIGCFLVGVLSFLSLKGAMNYYEKDFVKPDDNVYTLKVQNERSSKQTNPKENK